MDPRRNEVQRSTRRAQLLESNSDTIVSQLAAKDNVPWYSKPNLRLLYLLMIPTCLAAEMSTGYDAVTVNGLQAIPSWLEYFHHPHSATLGLMVSMYSLGCIAAVPFAPSVIDNIGRRSPILLTGVISMIGGVLQGFAMDITMFIIGRFILGFCTTVSVIAASALTGELSYHKERAVMSGLVGACYYLGSIIAACVTLWTFSMNSNWGWRIPCLLQIIPGLLRAFFISFVPESPRWLVSRGREDEALSILVKYHAEGDENSEFVHAEYAQIKEMIEAGLKVTTSWNQLFLTAGMRKRMIIATILGLCLPGSGVGLIEYFLPVVLDNIGIHDNQTKIIFNFAIVFWQLTNSTVIVTVASRLPRRTMYLACTISLCVVLTAFTVVNAEYSLTHDPVLAKVAPALIFLHCMAFNLAFGTFNYTFLIEIFPFHARTSGIALYQWWFRCGAFLAQFMNPIGLDAGGWRWYIIYCVWNALMVGFVYFMLPETSGRTLEELSFLFEDDQVVLREGEIGRLCEQGVTGRYGTMEER